MTAALQHLRSRCDEEGDNSFRVANDDEMVVGTTMVMMLIRDHDDTMVGIQTAVEGTYGHYQSYSRHHRHCHMLDTSWVRPDQCRSNHYYYLAGGCVGNGNNSVHEGRRVVVDRVVWKCVNHLCSICSHYFHHYH